MSAPQAVHATSWYLAAAYWIIGNVAVNLLVQQNISRGKRYLWGSNYDEIKPTPLT